MRKSSIKFGSSFGSTFHKEKSASKRESIDTFEPEL